MVDEKIILEREYIVPLRKKWLKTPKYKRAAKAIKALKQFLTRHMKVEERDLRKVKLDRYLNEEMWFRGIRNPPAKIKVKAKKFDNGIVKVELAEIPAIVKFRMDREKRRFEKIEKEAEKKEEKPIEKVEEKKPEEKAEEKKPEERVEEKEKGKATVEAGLQEAKKTHREIKHEIMEKHGIKKPLARKALKK